MHRSGARPVHSHGRARTASPSCYASGVSRLCRTLPLLATCCAALGLLAREAHACRYLLSAPRPVEATAGDTGAPELFDAQVLSIGRGQGLRPQLDENGALVAYVGTTCDGVGTLRVVVSALDDHTPGRDLRFRVEVVEGTAPIRFLAEAVAAIDEDQLFFTWMDGASEEQEPLRFLVRLRAVDGAGNESSPLDLWVEDPGRQVEGEAPPGLDDTAFGAHDVVDRPEHAAAPLPLEAGGMSCATARRGAGARFLAPPGWLGLAALGLIGARRRRTKRPPPAAGHHRA